MSKRESNVPLQADAHPLRSPLPCGRTHAASPRCADGWGFAFSRSSCAKQKLTIWHAKGFLNADARNDPHAIREALYRFLDSTLNRSSVTRNKR